MMMGVSMSASAGLFGQTKGGKEEVQLHDGASLSAAGGASQCPADTIPIQIVIESWSGPVTTLSAAGISDTYPHFRAFVTAVTEHVAARLTKGKLCLGSADSKKQSLLQFANWPLANWRNENPVPVLPPDAQPLCRITSPWIDLAIERKPFPTIRGIVRWNQRQLLADHALLAGARNVPPGVAAPLKSDEFERFANDYAGSEILHEPAAKPIEERVPPDLLWLFRRTTQSTHGSFAGFASSAMRRAMEKGSVSYTKLVIALIDRCLDSDGAEIRYGSILDAADLIPLEKYKIDTPIH